MFSTRRALPLLTLDAATLAAASSLQRRVSTQARAHLCEPPLLSTRAQASPLFATLTASLQLIENPSALSPAFATLTRCLALTPLFATLTKNRGGYPITPSLLHPHPKPFPLFPQLVTSCHLQAPATPFLSYVYSHFPSPRGRVGSHSKKSTKATFASLVAPSRLLPLFTTHCSLFTCFRYTYTPLRTSQPSGATLLSDENP
jgi:hypothetical protein